MLLRKAVKTHRLASIAIIAASGLALGADTVYAPAGATQWNDGYRSAVFRVPAAAPRGTVELASFGVVELTPDDTPAMPALLVRLVVANTADDAAWTFDARTVELVAPGTRLRPTIVNSDVLTLPIAIVDPGHRTTLDLYFALPRDRAPAELQLVWQVKTPHAAIAETTRFGFDPTAPPSTFVVRRAGWAANWWFDPAYEWRQYFHQPGVAVPRPPEHVLITRPPLRHLIPNT